MEGGKGHKCGCGPLKSVCRDAALWQIPAHSREWPSQVPGEQQYLCRGLWECTLGRVWGAKLCVCEGVGVEGTISERTASSLA
jgi:hypothetical protein